MNKFEIVVTVKYNYRMYTRRRNQAECDGTNHIENISSTASYMGEEILREIKQEKIRDR